MTTFYNLIDSKLNWGVSFHYNPVYLLFANPEGGKEISYLPLSYLLFCQIFFFVPILVGLFQKFRFSLPFLIGAFSTLFFSVFVVDFLFWSALHALPMVIYLLGQVRRSHRLKYLFVFLAALLWSWCGGPLGFFGGICLVWLIKNENTPLKLAFLSSALISSVLFLIPFPLPKFPDGARLFEITPVLFWPGQFWGPTLNPSPLNYAQYFSRLTEYRSTAATNVLLVLALLFQLRSRIKEIGGALNLILITSLFLLGETFLNGALTQNLAPLMYGLPLLPFPWLLCSFGVLLSFGLYLSSPPSDNLPFNLGFTILVIFYLSNLVSNFDEKVVEAQSIGTQFSSHISRDKSEVVQLNLPFSGLRTSVVSTSVNQENAKTLTDHHLDTRWTSNAAITGSEWIDIKLKEAVNCSVLSLTPGAAKTDFPRGIKVEVSDDLINYRQAAHIDNWKGPIRSTPEGFLYYGPQNEVELKLDQAENIRGLKVYQIGKDVFYYWSVAEVRCAKQ